MEWEEVPEEEVKKLKFMNRAGSNGGQYDSLMEAVKSGKNIKVKLDQGVSPKAMAQRLYTGAKSFGIEIKVRTLQDKTAVVVSYVKPPEPGPVPDKTPAQIAATAPPAESGDPPAPEPPADTQKPAGKAGK